MELHAPTHRLLSVPVIFIIIANIILIIVGHLSVIVGDFKDSAPRDYLSRLHYHHCLDHLRYYRCHGYYFPNNCR